MSDRSLGPAVLFLALAIAIGSCLPVRPVKGPGKIDGRDPFDVVHTVVVDAKAVEWLPPRPLPADAYRWCGWRGWRPFALIPNANAAPRRLRLRTSIISPGFDSLLADTLTQPDRPTVVIISFDDPVEMPFFPVIAESLPLNAGPNLAARAHADSLIAHLYGLRAADYAAESTQVVAMGGRVLGKYWITQALLVELPLHQIPLIQHTPGALYAEPQTLSLGFPQDDIPTTVQGRAAIGTQHYRTLGLAGGRIALIDSGLRGSHPELQGARISLQANCYACSDLCPCDAPPAPGTTACRDEVFSIPTTLPIDDDSGFGHGTSTAGILVGTSIGITDAELYSYRVGRCDSAPTCNPIMCVDGAIRAMQGAIQMGLRFIVAELEDPSPPYAAMSRAADNAYIAGAVFVSAIGNAESEPGCAPGNAHLSIGAGAYELGSPGVYSSSHGPTIDGRHKPELLGPTGTLAPINYNDVLVEYDGTSGSTPYVAAGALVIRNLILPRAKDAGATYAAMIACGDDNEPFADDAGAGRFKLPRGAALVFGKIRMKDGCVKIPLAPPAMPPIPWNGRVSAALWWPEHWLNDLVTGPGGGHSDIDLEVWDGNGALIGRSDDRAASFERTSGMMVRPAGSYLRIRAVALPHGAQTVYWAAWLSPPPSTLRPQPFLKN